MAEELDAVVERVTFQNVESGFCVLRARTKKTICTIVGHLPGAREGDPIRATGVWREDPRYGLQFAAESIVPRRAEGRVQIETFLGSGAIRGVGPSTATLMWTHFREKVFDVLDNEPERLRELPGIGAKRAAMIAASWRTQQSMRDLLVFLADSGIGQSRAARIQKQYGADAVRLIRENPYRLAREIRGIGFTTADQLAMKLGIARDAPERIRAGVRHVLEDAALEGHCALPAAELLRNSIKLLGVAQSAVAEAVAHEGSERRLAATTLDGAEAFALPRLFRAEHEVAGALLRLAKGKPPWPGVDIPRALQWVEKQTGLRLAASQRAAVATVLQSRVAVITGGPGVGKTTLVNSILRILAAKDVDVALAAPTGRAARRLAESTGRVAKTIHRLLEINPQSGTFARARDTPLDCDLLVIDEASMVDVQLMAAIVAALNETAALLLVGDVDQLPAVGPGQILGDIIRSGVIPTVRLTDVFRQAAESRIIVNAHRINHGEVPDLRNLEGSDFFFARASGEQLAERIVKLVCERIPARFGFDPLRDVQVLAPMRRTVDALNTALQRALNPPATKPDAPRIERMGTSFHAGDKVMQTVNDYEKDVFNGDIGVIRELDAEEGTALVDFDEREIEMIEDDFDDIVLAWATTIHKSQGSEYPAVVIALTRQHTIMLQRNLLYTAVTRGRKLVVIAGEEEAVTRAVAEKSLRRRWTKLREWLEVK
ncbi:MAG TPA: ATP-dependent RecD-like DNA helicase [Thermoanaerobaculia bacterium]|nr:ATP-dependent RecD-like DNA helicase [Thermoanaerobaculia bacterium]